MLRDKENKQFTLLQYLFPKTLTSSSVNRKVRVLVFDKNGTQGLKVSLKSDFFPQEWATFDWLYFKKDTIFFVEETDLLTSVLQTYSKMKKLIKQAQKCSQCNCKYNEKIKREADALNYEFILEKLKREIIKKIANSIFIFLFLPKFFRCSPQKTLQRLYRKRLKFLVVVYPSEDVNLMRTLFFIKKKIKDEVDPFLKEVGEIDFVSYPELTKLLEN